MRESTVFISEVRELAVSDSETVRIYASEKWNHTFLKLIEGGIYRFVAVPPDQKWGVARLRTFDADGKSLPHLFIAVPFLRMPSAKWFSLIGCIGEKHRNYFKIGKCLDLFVAPSSGELICFANDVRKFSHQKNRGHIDVMVTRLR